MTHWVNLYMEVLSITLWGGHADGKEMPFSFMNSVLYHFPQSFSLLAFLNWFSYIGSLLHSGHPDIAPSTLLLTLSTISNCRLWNYFQFSWNSYPLKADRSKHKIFFSPPLFYFLLLCSMGCRSYVHHCMLIQVQMTAVLPPVRHIIACNLGFVHMNWMQAQQTMTNMSWDNFCEDRVTKWAVMSANLRAGENEYT